MEKYGVILKDGCVVGVYDYIAFTAAFDVEFDDIIEANSQKEAEKKALEKYGAWYKKKKRFVEEVNARYSPEQVYGIRGLL